MLDVRFGYGDMLRAIARWAKRRDIDVNPRAAQAARRRGEAAQPILWLTGDHAELEGGHWDFIISSQVAHHMSRDELLSFLRFMERNAAAGWLVSDLRRNRAAYLAFPLLARLTGSSSWTGRALGSPTPALHPAGTPGSCRRVAGTSAVLRGSRGHTQT